ncbi:phenoloxidase-activating factor 2 [Drosophila eugracilis]|uniref:phenoloxidase-activating factor 2 n=1 Tax=Drosophila eugracilis TaxID=29029 RepID=UPI0007E7EB1D|nr:phenoloxidase-activating factor 2 [Drosophila eugracilis]
MTPYILFLLLCSFANAQQTYKFQLQRAQNQNYLRESYPWVVAVLDQRYWLTRYIGVGSLIRPNVVLTACRILNETTEYDLLVRAGGGNISTTTDQRHVDLEVLKIVRHEGFSPYTAVNNIAMLILKSAFTMTDNIQMIQLNLSPEVIYNGYSCFFNGWGKAEWNSDDYPDVIKKIQIVRLSDDVCKIRLNRELPIGQFCGDGFEGKDCNGDGGAPLVCQTFTYSPSYVQVGIVNWGTRKPGDKRPIIFTDVLKLSKWINSTLNLSANFQSNDNYK